jgi:hypothetical protein
VGETRLSEVEEAIFENTVYKPAVIVANKTDVRSAKANLSLLQSHVAGRLPIVAVSCTNGNGLGQLAETLFASVGIMRVYTKEPNQREYSKKPFILKRGAAVYDLAKSIHTDLSKRFSFAKVWAKRLAFSPQKVGTAFVLQDGDIVEIHAR